MIIYLEGPDGSGKSTLRAELIKALAIRQDELQKLEITKIVENGEELIPTRPTNPKRLSLISLFTELCHMAEDLRTLFICDRGPISDVIYRVFDEYQPILTLNQYMNFWIRYHHFIVTVYCDTDQSEEVLKTRGDNNPIALANHRAIRYLYKQIMPLFSPIKYDFGKFKNNLAKQSKVSLIIESLFNELYQVKTELKKREEKE